ncbi:hypothetical protein [Reyranella sp.]|uniref:hypothetical protein n=1 Tax=Reyranella sp. TaxID=1929291 RepID=UPI002F1674BE
MKRRRMSCGVAVVFLALSACASKGTLDRSSVETVRVEGRLFEVRIAPTEADDEYSMMIVRATLVIEPDPARERERAWNVARPFMERTCKGRPYKVLEDRLVDRVNLYTRFRCGG